MPRLLLLRHAKSSWTDGDLTDHDRPLNDRGRAAAPLIGAYMAAEGLQPDLVVCSTSARTRQTLDLIRDYIPPTCEIVYDPDIYLADAAELGNRLRRLDPRYKTVLLVGHNTGLEELARQIAGAGDAEGLARLRVKYPTAGLAVIDFDGPWSTLAMGRGHLDRFVTPRSLAAN